MVRASRVMNRLPDCHGRANGSIRLSGRVRIETLSGKNTTVKLGII